MSSASDRRPYVIPRYRAAVDTAFYHVLHGTVPGHQMDYLYCPEVPQGALRQTHFGHLSRLIKYIEPRAGAEYAFALGNLSRDDTQHEPGHGGVALLFALRVPGVTDHAGRDTPPYAHGLVAIGRALDRTVLFDAATAFYRRFLERDGARDRRGDFYREYVRTVEERPEDVEPFLSRSMAAMDDLPRPGPSGLSWDIEADEAAPARRVVIVHDDGERFERIARGAAALGAMLYRSNIKWTSISTGRALDIPGGTTVRFVPASEAASEEGAVTVHIDELPESDADLAEHLFGARLRADRPPAPSTPAAPSAPCPAPEVAQPVIEPAATCPTPEGTQTVIEPAATCPMAPLESAIDPPESAVRPRAAPAASCEASPASGNPQETPVQPHPRRGLFLTMATVVLGAAGVLFAFPDRNDSPAPQPRTADQHTAASPPEPGAREEPHAAPRGLAPVQIAPPTSAPATAPATTATAPTITGNDSPFPGKKRNQARGAPRSAVQPRKPVSVAERRPETASSQGGSTDVDWGVPGGERTWGRQD